MRYRILIPLLALAACSAPQGHTVQFEIAMSGPIQEGWFHAATDSVGLRGGSAPLAWDRSVPMADEDGDGVYEAEVTFSDDAPDVVEYKAFVTGEGSPNGRWERGANRWFNPGTMPVVSRPYEDSPEPLPSSYTGTIEEHPGFGTGSLVAQRDLIVWLPPGYSSESDRRYPVLYLHDGQNVFDRRAAGSEWGMDEAATALIEEGSIEPVIIVGVANTPARVDEYTPVPGGFVTQFVRTGEGNGDSPLAGTFEQVDDPAIRVEVRGNSRIEIRWPGERSWIPAFRTEDGWYVPSQETTIRADETSDGRVSRFTGSRDMGGGEGADYARFLVEEVKAFVDSTYRTIPDREHTSVGGSSLGGLISMSIGTWYRDVFGALLVVSPSVWWGRDAIVGMVREAAMQPRPRVWLDIGTAEGPQAVTGARRLRDALVERGWTEGEDLVFVEDAGAPHNEDAWAARTPDMLRFLYGR